MARECIKRRGMLLYLLTEEIEHLITWYNPTAKPELMIADEVKLMAWHSQVKIRLTMNSFALRRRSMNEAR